MATAVAGDPEMRQRVRRHQAERGPLWDTFEWPMGKDAFSPDDAPAPLEAYGVILFDCLTLWISGWMEKKHTAEGRFPATLQADTATACTVLLRSLRALPCPVVMVSNEVGMGLVPASYEGRLFRDLAGEANQATAACADTVILTVSGLPLLLKGVMPH